ncbi:MAG: protein phosphatase CheZ [Desulfovibrionales bacterium]
MQNEILIAMTDRICADVTRMVQQTLEQTVEREVARALQKALMDGEFYRSMSVDVHSGLNKIYGEVLQLKRETGNISLPDLQETEEVLGQAADKLDSIIETTEQATLEIIDVVENQLEAAAELTRYLEQNSAQPHEIAKQTARFVERLNDDFLKILTTLSFQDITGQHIKKIIVFIKKIEALISQLYLSQDALMKEKVKNPEVDMNEIKKNAQEKISQGDIDTMLAQYGLE